jgi:hypothetical protein
LYFSATTPKTAISTNKVLKDIWKQSCTATNEQIVTTNVIKKLYRSKASNNLERPKILNHEKYLNFCNTNCGSDNFRKVKSLSDLHYFEEEMKDKLDFKVCSKEYRKEWVFFHASCTQWPDEKPAGLSKAKGAVQKVQT